jgi:hypothetical protein
MSHSAHSEPVRLIVVEAYDVGYYHRVVEARHQDRPHRQLLYVHKTPHIEFGDTILMKDGKLFWLERGPLLKFRLFLEAFPDDVIQESIPRQREAYPTGEIAFE